MKYKVVIPKFTKRMTSGRIVVNKGSGWEIDKDEIFPITNEIVDFVIEVPDKYEWFRSTSIIDGFTFKVFVEFVNSTGSRKETKELVPERI